MSKIDKYAPKCDECNSQRLIHDLKTNATYCIDCGYYDVVCPICEDYIPVVKINKRKYLCEDCDYVFNID